MFQDILLKKNSFSLNLTLFRSENKVNVLISGKITCDINKIFLLL